MVKRAGFLKEWSGVTISFDILMGYIPIKHISFSWHSSRNMSWNILSLSYDLVWTYYEYIVLKVLFMDKVGDKIRTLTWEL